MRAAERRERILDLLRNAENPVSGSALAKIMGVSRQIIVQDITLLRTGLGVDIVSTYQGYVIPRQKIVCSRVFKVRHSSDRTCHLQLHHKSISNYLPQVLLPAAVPSAVAASAVPFRRTAVPH